VAITHTGLGSGKGVAKLYLDGKLQGSTEMIREPFRWDMSRAAIRLGVNYVGLWDELAIFSRALSDGEIAELHRLKGGLASARR
jgi:concanavalin A-like lectin/glucanase superfamily protein